MTAHTAITAQVEDASTACPTCAGRGLTETGEIKPGIGGHGFEFNPCADCDGTGEVTRWDHDRFDYQHGLDVKVEGESRVLFFDYEGDDVFVFWFPGDEATDGPKLTDKQREDVYEQLCDWYRDWCAYDPEDRL